MAPIDFCDCESCTNWRDSCKHTTLRGRTDDPDALSFDEAVDLFREGLALARDGSLEEAAVVIAQAYLLDYDCLTVTNHLPPQDKEEAANYLLDAALVGRLLGASEDAPSDSDLFVANIVIRTALVIVSGGGTNECLAYTEKLLQFFDENADLEPILDGHCKPSKLHYMRYRLYKFLDQHENALKELEDGLALDSTNALMLVDRAAFMSSHDFVSDNTIVKEWRSITEVCHPDSFVLPIAYSRLSFHILGSPQQGTFEEGCVYLEKTKEAYRRYLELNGDERPKAAKVTCTEVSNAHKVAEKVKAKEDERKTIDLWFATSPAVAKNAIPGCNHCGKMQGIGGDVLSKCARCKVAYYCCKACQTR